MSTPSTAEVAKQERKRATSPVLMARERAERERREELTRMVEECGGNLAEIARRLNLSRSTVIYRCQKYGLY